jgi:dTDP-4-dehydrorhamnose reductase
LPHNVFDGKSATRYVEDSPTRPLNVYGRSKYEAEQKVLQIMPEALVVRTSAFFGPWDSYNYVTIALKTLLAGQPFIAPNDNLVSPTYVPDLVHSCLDLLIDGEIGLWHLANQGAVSWFELVHLAAELAAIDTGRLRGEPGKQLLEPAPRPNYSVLDSQRGRLLPSLEDALPRYLAEGELLRQEEMPAQPQPA